MFGYVVVNKPEMKFKEFDIYHSYYCGLCRKLKEKFGFIGQLSLGYDMTFLVILLTGLYEPQNIEKNIRCVLHPFEKYHVNINKYTEYAADMNIMMSYYKSDDDWKDERKITKGIFANLIRGKNTDISRMYERKSHIIKENFEMLNKAEDIKEENIDLISGYFGNIMSELFVPQDDEWSENLSKMGFYLGKFIYILDAYEDVLEDVEKGNYNPFTNRYKEQKFDDWIKQILILSAAECAKEFEKLPIIYNVEILRNIIYSGIWTRYSIVKEKRNKKND